MTLWIYFLSGCQPSQCKVLLVVNNLRCSVVLDISGRPMREQRLANNILIGVNSCSLVDVNRCL
jgi:hypothetical protein